MARIRTYQSDTNITASDKWIGTDGNDNNNTKNFSPNNLADFFNKNESISNSSISFIYDTIVSGSVRKQGTLSFKTEIGPIVPISSLTTFMLSRESQGGNYVDHFLQLLNHGTVVLHKSDNVDIYGLFKIINIVLDTVETEFYNVTLNYISGNGSIEEDKDYLITLIDLSTTNITNTSDLINDGSDGLHPFISLQQVPPIPSIDGLATVTYVDQQDLLKVDKVAGKSLISDSEITRLAGVTNFDNSGNIAALANKVDKVTGKGLSTNDFTNTLKTKLDGIADGAEVNVNADWNSVSGDSQILNKPSIPSISGLATITYVDQQDLLKVDKVTGKGLSTNDYTTIEQTKLAGIAPGAEVNVNADWNAISGDAQILNKPTIPGAITNTSQLINDGDNGITHFISLEDLPSNIVFFPTSASSDISGYNKIVTSITDPSFNTIAVNISTGSITTTNQLIASLATSTNIINGNPGVFNVTTIGNIRRISGSGTASFFFKVYKRNSSGVETLIATSDNTIPVLDSGTFIEFSATAIWDDGIFLDTDRVVIKYIANRISGGSNPTYEFQFGGSTPVRTLVPIPLAVIPILKLDDLLDVNSPTPLNNDGLFYETSTSLWKNKSIPTVLGYIPASQSITISTISPLQGGGDLSLNRTLSISQSNSVSNGYLSSTDWSAFNSKQGALSGTGFVKSSSGVISYDTNVYLTTINGIAAGGELSGTYANPSLLNSAVTGKILTGVNITGGTILATDSILTALGKVQNQINGVLGGAIYQSVWNASTNSPALTSSVGTKGYYYIVSVDGATNLNGITDWKIGDWAIFNGSTWNKVDNSDSVSSVNGFTGAVSLTSANISEVTNLYYTDTRARAAISLTTTGNSGASTYTSGVLNVPNYTLSGLGGVSLTGTETISGLKTLTNGLTFNNSTGDNITFNINGTYSGSQFVGNSYFQFDTVGTYLFKTSGIGNALTINNNGTSIFLNSVTASSFIKSGGTSSQFLKADGSIDSSTYLTSAAPVSGSANYIQNQNTSAQSANMWISGTGTFDTSISTTGQIATSNGVDTNLLLNTSVAGADIKYGSIQSSIANRNLVLNPTNGGNVGIGTTSPNRLLTLGSSSSSTMSFNSSAYRNTTIGSDYYGNFVVYDDTAAAYRMVVASSGNVLIGTTTDNATDKLQVNGSAKFTSSIEVQGVQGLKLTNGSAWTINSDANYLYFSEFNVASWLKIQKTSGAATFASSVTINGACIVQNASYSVSDIKGTNSNDLGGGVLRFSNQTKDFAIITGETESVGNGQMFFRVLKSGTVTTAITLASTGAATFASSVTATSINATQGIFGDVSIKPSTYSAMEIQVPDTLFRQIRWTSSTKECISFTRDAGAGKALEIFREPINGYSALQLFNLNTSGAATFANSVTATSHVTTGGTTSQLVDGTGALQTIPSARPYKVYTALMTQSGTSTNSVVATVLENTIGAIVWARSSTGTYYGTLTGAFTTNKTSLLLTNGDAGNGAGSFVGSWGGVNFVFIQSFNIAGTVVDSTLRNATVEIRVYN